MSGLFCKNQQLLAELSAGFAENIVKLVMHAKSFTFANTSSDDILTDDMCQQISDIASRIYGRTIIFKKCIRQKEVSIDQYQNVAAVSYNVM